MGASSAGGVELGWCSGHAGCGAVRAWAGGSGTQGMDRAHVELARGGAAWAQGMGRARVAGPTAPSWVARTGVELTSSQPERRRRKKGKERRKEKKGKRKKKSQR